MRKGSAVATWASSIWFQAFRHIYKQHWMIYYITITCSSSSSVCTYNKAAQSKWFKYTRQIALSSICTVLNYEYHIETMNCWASWNLNGFNSEWNTTKVEINFKYEFSSIYNNMRKKCRQIFKNKKQLTDVHTTHKEVESHSYPMLQSLSFIYWLSLLQSRGRRIEELSAIDITYLQILVDHMVQKKR